MSSRPPIAHPGSSRPPHTAALHGGTHHAAHVAAHRPGPRPRRRKLSAVLFAACRTVHIYLTMLGLLVMLLFGITGFTINHELWLGATDPQLREVSGTLPKAVVDGGDRLAIVEALRSEFRISGAVTNYDTFDEETDVSFKEPGQIWDVRVYASDGAVEVRHEMYNFAAVVNNLHRGRYTGPAWRWVIDISALLIVLACITGFILWLALPRRRRLGIAFMALGTILTMAIIYWFVPGPDDGLAPRSYVSAPGD